MAEVDRVEVWDTPRTVDKVDRFWVEGEVGKEAVWDTERVVDKVGTVVEVDSRLEDMAVDKGKVRKAVAADTPFVVDIRDTLAFLDTWVAVVREVADRVADIWVVEVPWVAVEAATELDTWDTWEAWVVSEAEDTFDSISSAADTSSPRVFHRAWDKGVGKVFQAADTWGSSGVDESTVERVVRIYPVGYMASVVDTIVCKTFSANSGLCYNRELTWKRVWREDEVAFCRALCPSGWNRFERISLALATSVSSILSINARSSRYPSIERV